MKNNQTPRQIWRNFFNYYDGRGRFYYTLRVARAELRAKMRQDPGSVCRFPNGAYIMRVSSGGKFRYFDL